MLLKIIIISVVIVAFFVLALGLKQWFNPKAKPIAHSCSFDSGETKENSDCASCEIKEQAHCTESKGK